MSANGFLGPGLDCGLVAIEAALLSSNCVRVAGAAEAFLKMLTFCILVMVRADISVT